jgi:hypothetical protein
LEVNLLNLVLLTFTYFAYWTPLWWLFSRHNDY